MTPAPEPQSILTPLTEAATFLVVTVDPRGEETVRDLLADLAGLVRAVGFRLPDAALSCITGIGSQLWDRLFPGQPRPGALHPFAEIRGARHTAPAPPRDLLFHIPAHRFDVCFQLATQLVDRPNGGHA